ncbi:response regulator [Hanstruepera marina]|uniref:response regulator n=1 Tax=Hanstruepera marina TaxID=2873265 RepID=UPI001CA685CE|nr:response regulator [Hanstruepera marina]
MKDINVLIIDDHPIIASSYKNALLKIKKDSGLYNFVVTEVVNIDDALIQIKKNLPSFYGIIFLDIKLSVSENGKYLSGEDLGIEIRRVSPKSKIIVATTYNDNYRIDSILKSINPDGFLIKNDMQPKDLIKGIIEVIEEPPHYSVTVRKLIRKHITSDIVLDKIDRQILYELSNGTKMTELPKVISMSISGIERRKRLLKDVFNITSKDDRDLVEIAREKGFI